MIRATLLLILVLLVSACGQPGVYEYQTADEVVAGATQHEFDDRFVPLFQLIGAEDGAKFTVVPGDYLVGVYTYKTGTPDPAVVEGVGKIVVVDRNALLVFHTTDRDQVDILLADIAARP